MLGTLQISSPGTQHYLLFSCLVTRRIGSIFDVFAHFVALRSMNWVFFPEDKEDKVELLLRTPLRRKSVRIQWRFSEGYIVASKALNMRTSKSRLLRYTCSEKRFSSTRRRRYMPQSGYHLPHRHSTHMVIRIYLSSLDCILSLQLLHSSQSAHLTLVLNTLSF